VINAILSYPGYLMPRRLLNSNYAHLCNARILEFCNGVEAQKTRMMPVADGQKV